MYERILVPTDGSEGVGAAIDHALDIADRYGATVHALSVVDTADLGLTTPADVDPDEIRSSLRADAEGATEAAAARAAEEGIEAVTAVRVGIPHESILDYVEGAGIDLVVMGTHGRTGLGRALLGSVTERVVRTAPVPVLTVRMTETGG